MSQQITKFIQDQAITAAKLANTAVSPGSYTNSNITVDQQGRITAAASGTASSVFAYRSVTTTDTCTTSDYTLNLSGSSFTQTLYTASGNTGRVLVIKHNGTSLTQVYTLATTGGQTIGGVASGSYALYTNGESLTLQSDGSNWIILDHKTITPWVSFTPTGTWSTNTTYTGRYQRIGDTAYFSVKAGLSGAPSGTFSVTLPGGLTIDTSKIVSTSVAEASFGQGHANDAGTNTYIGDVVYASSTSINMVGSAGSAALWSATVPFSFNNTDTVVLQFAVPITGWQA